MNSNFLLIVAFLTGVLVALQGVINSQLGRALEHPMQATLFNFLVGSLAAIVVLAVMGKWFPSWHSMTKAPWYLYTGGLLGATFVTSILLLVPRIGVASVVTGLFVGQMITAMLIDHFGVLGVPKLPLTPQRMIGAALLLVGLLVIQYKPTASLGSGS